MKTEPTHTPTPWKFSESLRNDAAYALLGDNELSNGGHHWKRIDNLQGGFTKEDAAFIVRAVNAHEDMLISLKQLAVRFQLEFKTTKKKCTCNQFVDLGVCRHLDALQSIARAEEASRD